MMESSCRLSRWKRMAAKINMELPKTLVIILYKHQAGRKLCEIAFPNRLMENRSSKCDQAEMEAKSLAKASSLK